MRKLKKLTVCLLAACIAGTTGCGKMKISKDKSITVSVITFSKGEEFWDTVTMGAMDAGNELGINVICEAPEDDADTGMQIELINNAIKAKNKAIVIAPIKAETLEKPLENAHEAGLKIINIYSRIDYSGISSFIGTDNKTAGEIAARNFAEILGGKGEIAIISIPDNINTAPKVEMKNAFIDILKKEYPNIKIVAQKNCSKFVESAKNSTIKYFGKYPNINGVYALDGITTEGVCKGVKQLEDDGKIKTGQIKVVGCDASSNEVKYIESGILNGTVLQDPYMYGYLGVRNAYKAINGEIIDSYINMGTSYVNSDNLYDSSIQLIINPKSE